LEFILIDKKFHLLTFVKSSKGTNEYDDESEIEQSSSSEGIYMDHSREREVGLYALEAIPKVRTLSKVDQKI